MSTVPLNRCDLPPAGWACYLEAGHDGPCPAHQIDRMQWRRWNGAHAEYEGPLIQLGQGIPRPMRGWGIRRAIFDLAFGYASGFPVRDIIPFALRSLFPTRVVDAVIIEAEEDEP